MVRGSTMTYIPLDIFGRGAAIYISLYTNAYTNAWDLKSYKTCEYFSNINWLLAGISSPWSRPCWGIQNEVSIFEFRGLFFGFKSKSHWFVRYLDKIPKKFSPPVQYFEHLQMALKTLEDLKRFEVFQGLGFQNSRCLVGLRVLRFTTSWSPWWWPETS